MVLSSGHLVTSIISHRAGKGAPERRKSPYITISRIHSSPRVNHACAPRWVKMWENIPEGVVGRWVLPLSYLDLPSLHGDSHTVSLGYLWSYKSEGVVDNLLLRFSSTRHPKIVNKKAIQLGGGGEWGVMLISRLPVHFILYHSQPLTFWLINTVVTLVDTIQLPTGISVTIISRRCRGQSVLVLPWLYSVKEKTKWWTLYQNWARVQWQSSFFLLILISVLNWNI